MAYIQFFRSGFLAASFCFSDLVGLAKPQYLFSTLSGSARAFGEVDTNDSTARFLRPSGVVVDDAGNLYVADTENCTIRKITPSGVVTTLAGTAGRAAYSDGIGSGAYFFFPSAIAVDSMRNLYVIDDDRTIVRKITPDGVVTTLAGHNGLSGNGNGTGTDAFFNDPRGLCVDLSGNVYVADSGDCTIRKITPSGVVTTLAGQSGSYGDADGAGSAARFAYPQGIASDSLGNLYVADSVNNKIRKITPSGVVTTLAGSSIGAGNADGTGGTARFSNPYGIAKGPDDSLYVVDGGNKEIRKVTAAGVVTTMKDYSGESYAPYGLSLDNSGNLYFADSYANDIVKMTSSGSVTVFAGLQNGFGSADGSNSAAPGFSQPSCITVGSSGNVYVCEASGPKLVRKISTTGVVSTLAQAGSQLSSAKGIVVDSFENVYVADSVRSVIFKITANGAITSFAGSAYSTGSSDGMGSDARFNRPTGLAIDGGGNIFVADSYSSSIRKITPDGNVTTLAANQGIQDPVGVAVDGAGNVFIANGDNTVRKLTPLGVVSILAGNFSFGYQDGIGAAALFNSPGGLAVDPFGNVFVADTGNNRIRMITPQGVVTTVGGGQSSGSKDGIGNAAQFFMPYAVAVDAAGNIYVADTENCTIRKGLKQPFLSDFNGDSQVDILWQNTVTGERFIWLMTGPNHAAGVSVGVESTQWSIAATADFNGDSQADILWQNSVTGERYLWYMSGAGHLGGASLGVVPTDWSIASAADFNGDGEADILWQNTVTGERYIWLMSGAGHLDGVSLGVVSTQWSIAATADFNGDGQTDILWQNTLTGERYIWFMSGAGHLSGASLGIVNTQWSIATAGDFNGDGHPDILWQNTVTGQRYLWLMDGPAHQSDVDLGLVDLNWKIVH